MNIYWIYAPTGFRCRTRKEMKDYLGKASFFRKALRHKEVRYIDMMNNNYIADNELQKNNLQNSTGTETT